MELRCDFESCRKGDAMNMCRESDEFIIDALRKNRGLVARLVLALRVLFSVPKVANGSWADGARGL